MITLIPKVKLRLNFWELTLIKYWLNMHKIIANLIPRLTTIKLLTEFSVRLTKLILTKLHITVLHLKMKTKIVTWNRLFSWIETTLPKNGLISATLSVSRPKVKRQKHINQFLSFLNPTQILILRSIIKLTISARKWFMNVSKEFSEERIMNVWVTRIVLRLWMFRLDLRNSMTVLIWATRTYLNSTSMTSFISTFYNLTNEQIFFLRP